MVRGIYDPQFWWVTVHGVAKSRTMTETLNNSLSHKKKKKEKKEREREGQITPEQLATVCAMTYKML